MYCILFTFISLLKFAQLVILEETAVTFVYIHITEKDVMKNAIVRKKGLNIYIIFNNKNRTIKIIHQYEMTKM